MEACLPVLLPGALLACGAIAHRGQPIRAHLRASAPRETPRGRPLEHTPVGREPRAVRRTVPAALEVVPGDDGAEVRADRAELGGHTGGGRRGRRHDPASTDLAVTLERRALQRIREGSCPAARVPEADRGVLADPHRDGGRQGRSPVQHLLPRRVLAEDVGDERQGRRDRVRHPPLREAGRQVDATATPRQPADERHAVRRQVVLRRPRRHALGARPPVRGPVAELLARALRRRMPPHRVPVAAGEQQHPSVRSGRGAHAPGRLLDAEEHAVGQLPIGHAPRLRVAAHRRELREVEPAVQDGRPGRQHDAVGEQLPGRRAHERGRGARTPVTGLLSPAPPSRRARPGRAALA